MANTIAPFGFIPVGHMSGGAIPEPHVYTLYTGHRVYKGDPMIVTSSGMADVAAANWDTIGLGIAAEYVYDSGSLGTLDVHVYDDPWIIYKAQFKTGITAPTLANSVFATANMCTYAVGSSVSHQSIMSLDTPGSSTGDFLILGLYPQPGNAWGDGAIVTCILNQSIWKTVYAGI